MAEPTIPSFIEKRFPEQLDWGFQGGPTFSTSIAETSGGHEQRIVNWSVARHRYTAERTVNDQVQLDALVAFFAAVRGRAVGFRFFDWSDYASDMDKQHGTTPLFTLMPAGLGVPQPMRNTSTLALGIGNGAATTYQLVKVYTPEPFAGDMSWAGAPTLTFAATTITRTSGSWVTDGFVIGQTVYCYGNNLNTGTLGVLTNVTATVLTIGAGTMSAEGPISNVRVVSQVVDVAPYIRDINKPIAARGYVNGVQQAGTLNTTTGVFTFSVAPAAGSTVRADFIFDVPVRFEDDGFVTELTNFKLGDVANLVLIEERL